MTAAPILLRPWTEADLPALLEIFSVSPDLVSQYPLAVTDLAQARVCWERMLVWDDTRRNLAIVVEQQGRGVPVGNVAVTAIEHRHDTGWMSYFSSGAVRGRGLVARSATAVANWALEELGVFRLELGHRVNNPASGAIAVAAGFLPEGRERQKLRYGDERFDTLSYSRLATDPFPRTPSVTFELPSLPLPPDRHGA
ncbi:GNAT family N-acetyltransferase [Nakamurella lactea]|uniref:GNAT family N-acetyltransferase n=1 Tax=Nakamurella lactea TaxID=459515 RepID=UPI00042164A8|nr:GNAT family protein [Nakamurella lactea]